MTMEMGGFNQSSKIEEQEKSPFEQIREGFKSLEFSDTELIDLFDKKYSGVETNIILFDGFDETTGLEKPSRSGEDKIILKSPVEFTEKEKIANMRALVGKFYVNQMDYIKKLFNEKDLLEMAANKITNQKALSNTSENPEDTLKSLVNNYMEEEGKIIKSKELKKLSLTVITENIFSIYKKVFGVNLFDAVKDNIFNDNDIIKVKDSIIIIDSLQEKVANPPEKELEIEIECKLSEFFEQYQKLLQEKTKELNLDQDQTYNIYSWFHNEDIYNKEEKNIDDETNFKNMNFDGFIIDKGSSKF